MVAGTAVERRKRGLPVATTCYNLSPLPVQMRRPETLGCTYRLGFG